VGLTSGEVVRRGDRKLLTKGIEYFSGYRRGDLESEKAVRGHVIVCL